MDTSILNAISENTSKIYKKIDDYIEMKGSRSLVFSSNTTDWITSFFPSISLDNCNNYEIGLVDLETYYSFPNISSSLKNNTFVYIKEANIVREITIPDGSYDMTDINEAIQLGMRINGDWDQDKQTYFIDISANNATLKSIINIKPGYSVDFTKENSLRDVLGFQSTILTTGYNISPKIVNILNTNAIEVNCDIISGSYNNGSQGTTLYSYFPSVAPGYKIIQTPVNIVYLPVKNNDIFNIRLWITDEKGNSMDFRGEIHTIRLHLRRKV